MIVCRILDALVVINWKPLWRSELLPLVRKVRNLKFAENGFVLAGEGAWGRVLLRFRHHP